MIFSGGRFSQIIKALNISLFSQHWEDANVNPPPPGSEVRITDAGDTRITDSGDIRITD
jgi:hypothetical protein